MSEHQKNTQKTVNEVKMQAKQIASSTSATYTQALHQLSMKAGFKRWDSYKASLTASNDIFKVVLAAYKETILFQGSLNSSQNFMNKLKGNNTIDSDAFHRFISLLREKHHLPPLNACTIELLPVSADIHKARALEIFGYFTPKPHVRYSYQQIIAKHCAGEDGRNTSGPFYEYTLVTTNELNRDLEESGVCFEQTRADNPEHPDFGKPLTIFTITKER